MKTKFDTSKLKNYFNYVLVLVAYLVLNNMKNNGDLSNSMTGMLIPICVYIVMAISLNLTVGVMGELSLGHAGFMSVGAFSGVVASAALASVVTSTALRLTLAMVVGAICAGLVSLIVVFPVLRLRGDYLAIVTLAFGEIIKSIVNVLYVGVDSAGLHFSTVNVAALNLLEDGKVVIQGPMGAVGVTKLSTFTAGIALILFTLFVVQNFISSRSGRAVMALRDNRIAAESIGISPSKYKTMAFVISAMLAGMAGALYSLNYTSVVASKFDFNTSILILMFVVLGGMGNITGSIIAATALTLLPELLRGDFSDYRMLIYAAILILVMLATNNPKLRNMVDNLKSKLFKKKEVLENDCKT